MALGDYDVSFLEAETALEEKNDNIVDNNYTLNALNPRSRSVSGSYGRSPMIRSAYTGPSDYDRTDIYHNMLRDELGLNKQEMTDALNPKFVTKDGQVFDSFDEAKAYRDDYIAGIRERNEDIRPQLYAGEDVQREWVDKSGFIDIQSPSYSDGEGLRSELDQARYDVNNPGGYSDEQALFRALSAAGPDMVGKLNLEDPYVIKGLLKIGRGVKAPEKFAGKVENWQTQGKHQQRDMNQYLQDKGGKGEGSSFTDYVGKGLSIALPAIVSTIIGGVLGPAIGMAGSVSGAGATGTSLATGSLSAGAGLGGAAAAGVGAAVPVAAMQLGTTGRIDPYTLAATAVTAGAGQYATSAGQAGVGSSVGGYEAGATGYGIEQGIGQSAGQAAGASSAAASALSKIPGAETVMNIAGSPTGQLAMAGVTPLAGAVLENQLGGGGNVQINQQGGATGAKVPGPPAPYALRDVGYFDEDEYISEGQLS